MRPRDWKWRARIYRRALISSAQRRAEMGMEVQLQLLRRELLKSDRLVASLLRERQVRHG